MEHIAQHWYCSWYLVTLDWDLCIAQSHYDNCQAPIFTFVRVS